MLSVSPLSIAQKTAQYAVKENRRQAALEQEQAPSMTAGFVSSVGTHLVFQGGPLLLLLRPKTIKEASKILTKTAYWGAIYNVGPKMLHKYFPHAKDSKHKKLKDDLVMAVISGTGFVGLNKMLGEGKLAARPIFKKIYDVLADAFGQRFATHQSSILSKNGSRAKKIALSVLLSVPAAILISNPKKLTKPMVYGRMSPTHLAVEVKKKFGKDFAKHLDKIFGHIRQ